MDEEMYDDEMQEDEINSYEEIKERLLFEMETWDLVAIVDNLFWAKIQIINWAEFQRQRKELAEAMSVSPEFAQYVFKNQKINEAFSMNPEKYKEHEERAKIAATIFLLIRNDEDVKKMLYRRLKELDYDEDDTDLNKSKSIQTIAELIILGNEVLEIEKNTGEDIQSIIADALEEMPTEEIVKLYDRVSHRSVASLPKVYQVVTSRLDEMNDKDFFIFLSNCNTEKLLSNPELKEKILEKIKAQQNSFFCTMYIKFFAQYDEFLTVLLPKIGKNERVNAVEFSQVDKEHDEATIQQLTEMINSFSEGEFVRYLLFTPECENEEIAKIVNKKIETISDDSVRFLFWAYDKMQPAPRGGMLEDVLVKRSLLKEIDGILDFIPTEDEEYVYAKRFQEYKYIKDLFTSEFPFPDEYRLADIDMENTEKTERCLLFVYKENNEKMQSFKDFLDYIDVIANAKDEDLYKTITKYNKQIQFREDREVNRNIFEYYMFVIFYLGNRVLNMDDEQFLRKLYLLSDTESLFIDTVITRMAEKHISLPCVYIEDTIGTNPKVDEKNKGSKKEPNIDKKPTREKDKGEKE